MVVLGIVVAVWIVFEFVAAAVICRRDHDTVRQAEERTDTVTEGSAARTGAPEAGAVLRQSVEEHGYEVIVMRNSTATRISVPVLVGPATR